jgi:hypothetical protein
VHFVLYRSLEQFFKTEQEKNEEQIIRTHLKHNGYTRVKQTSNTFDSELKLLMYNVQCSLRLNRTDWDIYILVCEFFQHQTEDQQFSLAERFCLIFKILQLKINETSLFNQISETKLTEKMVVTV